MLPPLIFDLFLIKFLTESPTSFFNVPKEDVKDDHRAQLVNAHLKKYPPISVVLKKGHITKIFRHQR
jgi:hypothetical protein